MYPPEIYVPMKAQLTEVGFADLTTAAQVEETLAKEGTTFFVINSVCGCAAGSARPAAINASKGEKTPDNLATVFAGVDKEAVDKLREMCAPYPPSSPCMAMFKDGKLVHFIERHQIEGSTGEAITAHLGKVFSHYC
tara:strand:- start:1189 stop:1599 length:411 start_codon:yes stop_codon:yes gene_type:complete